MTVTHSVALSFEDGVTRFILPRRRTVADASYRQRINIPLDCRDGACGTCKGAANPASSTAAATSRTLSADGARAGYVLPCSMKPRRSDLVLQIATIRHRHRPGPLRTPARWSAPRSSPPPSCGSQVEIPNRFRVAFLPGQYVNIGTRHRRHAIPTRSPTRPTKGA